jgi:N-carbamoylputrescine amidase
MREITVAATQFACSWDRDANIARAEALVRKAAGEGAELILLQELFETPYFPQEERAEHFALAASVAESRPLQHMRALAKELGVVLPVSFFERAHQAFFNSLALVDTDGAILGLYRKAHIPAGPGYQEKFYFTPGDTGFHVFETRLGRIGAAICWDQWFPETARVLALKGAEILLYPTAIGSEPPPAPPVDSRHHWRRVMQGHAAANIMPLVASNRIGRETASKSEIAFYGSSFIAGPEGEIVVEAPSDQEAVITARFDLDAIALKRRGWGVFRDRRPELYGAIGTVGG